MTRVSSKFNWHYKYTSNLFTTWKLTASDIGMYIIILYNTVGERHYVTTNIGDGDPKSSTSIILSHLWSMWVTKKTNNKAAFGDGLYNPFLVIFGMTHHVYSWVYQHIEIPNFSSRPSSDAPRRRRSCRKGPCCPLRTGHQQSLGVNTAVSSWFHETAIFSQILGLELSSLSRNTLLRVEWCQLMQTAGQKGHRTKDLRILRNFRNSRWNSIGIV